MKNIPEKLREQLSRAGKKSWASRKRRAAESCGLPVPAETAADTKPEPAQNEQPEPTPANVTGPAN